MSAWAIRAVDVSALVLLLGTSAWTLFLSAELLASRLRLTPRRLRAGLEAGLPGVAVALLIGDAWHGPAVAGFAVAATAGVTVAAILAVIFPPGGLR